MTSSTEPRVGVGPALVVLLAAAAVFGVLAFSVLQDAYFDWDIALTRAIQSVRGGGLDALTMAASWLGFPPQSNGVIGAIVVLLFLARQRWEALCVAIGATITAVMWFQLAPLFDRPRPSEDLVPVGSGIDHGSFPSGHVLILTTVFGLLAYTAFLRLRGVPRVLAMLACGIFLLVLGYARIYAGDHWPSDVLGGYLLGTVCLVALILLHRWLTDRRRAWN